MQHLRTLPRPPPPHLPLLPHIPTHKAAYHPLLRLPLLLLQRGQPPHQAQAQVQGGHAAHQRQAEQEQERLASQNH